MNNNKLIELESGGFVADSLSELIREGAQKLLAQAVEAVINQQERFRRVWDRYG